MSERSRTDEIISRRAFGLVRLSLVQASSGTLLSAAPINRFACRMCRKSTRWPREIVARDTDRLDLAPDNGQRTIRRLSLSLSFSLLFFPPPSSHYPAVSRGKAANVAFQADRRFAARFLSSARKLNLPCRETIYECREIPTMANCSRPHVGSNGAARFNCYYEKPPTRSVIA